MLIVGSKNFNIYVVDKDLNKIAVINLSKVLARKSRMPSARATDCIHPKKLVLGTLGSEVY